MPESKLSASASASTARSAGSLGIRFVYLLATIQFVWFYLAHVPAAMQMAAYEQGHERTPFQYRALMMAPMLLAHHAAVFASAAAWLTRLPGWFSGSVSPEGVMQALVDCLSLVISGWAATTLYRRSSRTGLLHWLVYPLMLGMGCAMYTLQTNHLMRFVYDLPGMAFFAVALLLIYSGSNLSLFIAVFVVATINRETTLLLLLFYALAEQIRGRSLPRIAAVILPLGAYWIAWHLWVVHHFAANPHAEQPRLLLNLASLAIPLSWPQLLGVFGYMLPTLIWKRALLHDPILRRWLSTLWAWAGFMMIYGLLMETRIFGELIPYASVALCLIAESWLAEHHAIFAPIALKPAS